MSDSPFNDAFPPESNPRCKHGTDIYLFDCMQCEKEQYMKIDKWCVENIWYLTVTETNFATVTDHGDPNGVQTYTQQLANDSEAQQLFAELSDDNEDVMWAADSIVGKYPAFHSLRP